MRFGLFANLRRAGAAPAIKSFIDWAAAEKHELTLCDEIREVAPDYNNYESRDELARQVDILVSMGGDGTLLATARAVADSGTPILGINLGSLGFLTQQTPEELVCALNAIVAEKYTIVDRMLLEAEINGEGRTLSPRALNDVVIDNGPVSRLLRINMQVNGEEVVTYMSDGLIISTPTGSTAYSLAVGGPIVQPDMDAIIASAIAPFSLTMRPMVFHGDDILDLTVITDGRPAKLTIDGQVDMDLNDGQNVRVRRAGFYARFVSFPESSYYSLLRTKLNWGLPPKY